MHQAPGTAAKPRHLVDGEDEAELALDADDHDAAAAGTTGLFLVVGATAAAAEPVDSAFCLVFVTAVGERKCHTRGNGDIARPVATAADASVKHYFVTVIAATATAAGVVDFLAGDVRDPARTTRAARFAGLPVFCCIFSRTTRATAASKAAEKVAAPMKTVFEKAVKELKVA